MYRFFETLLVDGGEARNTIYHNRRLNSTIAKFFDEQKEIDLTPLISSPNHQKWKCKVTYSHKIEKIEWFLYKARSFRSFKLLHSNISYPYKSVDRESLDTLLGRRGNNDEVIIIKDGLISDTTISNIAIFEKGEWLTPKTPLLEGTTRCRLLERGEIKEADICIERLKSAKKIAMMNALMGFYIIERPILEE